MTPCPEVSRVQDFLDRELSPREADGFRAHLEGCAECGEEIARFRRVFTMVETARTWDPGPALTERILERVLPARIRRRWMRTLGFGYAAALAATAAGLATLIATPVSRDVVVALSAAASRGLVQGLAFVLNTVSLATIGLADSWGLVNSIGQRLAPFGRALAALFSHSTIGVTVFGAALACGMLLWWMRPRDEASSKEIRHVGVLGF